MGPDAMILVFWMLSFKPAFSLSSSTFNKKLFQFSSVQLLSRIQLFAIPWIAACQVPLSITNSRSSLRLTSIESVMPSSPLILCRPILLLPPIPPSIRVFSNSSLFAIRVMSSAYLRLLIFLLAILIPSCDSSSPAFCMMDSAYKLNKQSDNIQPWRTPFPIWNQYVVPHPVLTIASWPTYTFLRWQVR